MSYNKQIRQQAQKLNLEVTLQQVNSIAGTLRFAGIRHTADLDHLIQQELQRLIQQAKQELPVVATNDPTDGTFQRIDASLQQGMCPRCGKKMRDVLLADYTPAVYCAGECRITLWPPEKAEK